MSNNGQNKAISRFARVLLGGASLAVAFSAPAAAQEAQAGAEVEETDTITVTATRRNEDILDVPYNITAVSGDDIERNVTLDSAELIRGVPGISMIDQGPRNAATFNSIRIRGLNVDASNNGDFAVASVASVSTYVNDTPVFGNFALVDLERVEILRGPQGTIYGSGSLGGTVRYLLREPQIGEFEGRISGSTSSVEGSEDLGFYGDGTINIPVANNFAIRANIAIADYPGITDYVNLYELGADGAPVQPNGVFDTGYDATTYRSVEDADTYAYVYGRVSALWEIAPNADITFNYVAQSDEVGGRRQLTEGVDGLGNPYGDYESGAVILEPSSRDASVASMEVDVDLGFATLTSSSSYYEIEGESVSDSSGFWANGGIANFYALFNPFALGFTNVAPLLYRTDRTYSDEAFVQELRLVSAAGGRFDWLVGAFYQDQQRSLTQGSDYVGFEAFADAYAAWYALPDFVSTDNVFTYVRAEQFRDLALFGELTWRFTDRARLTGGFRWFDNESEVGTNVGVGAFDAVRAAGVANSTFERGESDTLFKLNLAVDIADDDLVYATISEGYRRGGNNAVVVQTLPYFNNAPGWQEYESDSVINYEVGVKGTVNGVRYDASAFFVDWQNPQLNTFAPFGDFFAVANGDGAQTQGIELQISGHLTNEFAYALGYAYVQAETSGDFINPEGALVAADGRALPGVPEHMLNLALNYTRPVSSGIDFIGVIDGYYQSGTNNLVEEADPDSRSFGGFTIWDATASLQTERWTASLFVKNIFNEEGTSGSFSVSEFGPNPGLGFYGSNSRLFIALPRTVGAQIAYTF
ncbi:TonB-dependent receptor [Terricaulis sp.]|uniref:TonB-dependent receptor n=1 Tax=Terricaulis sp. TaxID=2768686 RepID=UPI002AC51C26|nr:TonB-dependent receptor [Terricaulis sp.]MDZ4691829.1 TonB-dependent receptor [Terricaulis sp.]